MLPVKATSPTHPNRFLGCDHVYDSMTLAIEDMFFSHFSCVEEQGELTTKKWRGKAKDSGSDFRFTGREDTMIVCLRLCS